MHLGLSFTSFLYLLRRMLRYGIIAVIVLALLNIYTWKTPIWTLYAFVFVFGTLIGAFHILIAGKRISKLPLPLLFIVEFLIVNFLTFDLLLFYFYFIDGSGSWPGWDHIQDIIMGDFYRSLIMDVVVTSSVILFYIKIEELMGDRLFARYLMGRYAKPRKEERIFMFIDMKDSTTIAEKLDDHLFYEFVNECFRLMSPSVLKTQAEILKYIGDEVIFTWKPKAGLHKNNCIRLFFQIEAILEKKSDEFQKKFGTLPEFKAGLHIGPVISAQIGDIKKSIDFSGDVINTAARIQSSCNELNSKLLISDDLKNRLPLGKKTFYTFTNMGEIELKGKEYPVELFNVTKTSKE